VRHPKVFLFDEPLSNLDAALRVQMRLEIERLHRALGTTMIYVTHDQVEAMTLADRIVALDGGVIRQVGAPLDLYAHPANLFVAGFIGSPRMNLLPARVTGVRYGVVTLALTESPAVHFALGLAAVRPDSAVTLGVRPEAVTILTGPAPAGAMTLTGKIETIERLGNITFAYIDIGASDLMTVQIIGLTALRHEQPVTLSIDTHSLHVFAGDGAVLKTEPAPVKPG
jgi:multiple sugar transport system ATP-binding protein